MRPILFIFLFLVACCSPDQVKDPIKKPATVAQEGFPELTPADGEAAFKLVEKQLSFGPRHVNSEGAEKCASYIAEFAKNLGYEVEIDTWTIGSRKFRNIVCSRKGQGNQFVVTGSHYDTKLMPNFVGANDGASSTGLLMQLMKEMAESDKWNHHCTIKFVFFDGEEAFVRYSGNDGLFGSQRYVTKIYQDKSYKNCRGMILLDMVGDKDFKLTIPSNSTKFLIDKTEEICKHLKMEKYFSILNTPDFYDDHRPFLNAGIPAIDLIDFEYGVQTGDNGAGSFWHTNEDTIDKLSPDSLHKAGMIFKHLLWWLSNNPLIKK